MNKSVKTTMLALAASSIVLFSNFYPCLALSETESVIPESVSETTTDPSENSNVLDTSYYSITLPQDWMSWTSGETGYASQSPDGKRNGTFNTNYVDSTSDPESYAEHYLSVYNKMFKTNKKSSLQEEPEKICFSAGSKMQRFVVGYEQAFPLSSGMFTVLSFAEKYPGGGIIHYALTFDNASADEIKDLRSQFVEWIRSVKMG